MRKFRKFVAAFLMAAVMFTAIPIKSNIVNADITYLDRESKVGNFIDGINSFLDRLYYIALDRPTDPDGRFIWFNHVIYDGYSGADVVRGILYSPEFLNKNCSNEEFVQILYQAVLDRNADAEGLSNWSQKLAAGSTRQSIIEGFLATPEWTNLCLIYGIPSGNDIDPTIAILPTDQSRAFCRWIYQSVTGDMPDENNVEIWAAQLINLQKTPTELAHDILFGPYASALSNYDWLVRVYRNILVREPNGDFQSCLDMINNGTVTREAVFTMSCNSNEWAQTCGGFGLLR